jgi:hypothetical protein
MQGGLTGGEMGPQPAPDQNMSMPSDEPTDASSEEAPVSEANAPMAN